MITHTNDSHQISSQNKTKSKLQIKKIAKNLDFGICKKLNLQHTFWRGLIWCVNMEWIQPEM